MFPYFRSQRSSSSLCCRCHGKWGTGSTESRSLTGNLMSAILEWRVSAFTCFDFAPFDAW